MSHQSATPALVRFDGKAERERRTRRIHGMPDGPGHGQPLPFTAPPRVGNEFELPPAHTIP
ncbi:hypothetical protein [Streptomyces qinglanensis]|uniref:hypothetical protein n=1 Tax=Streptomyces qinglanensis TaxID=943816 RepID=UPI003D71BCB8